MEKLKKKVVLYLNIPFLLLSCHSVNKDSSKLALPSTELVFINLENGKAMPAGNLVNGMKEGLWLEYDTRDGSLFIATSYFRGKKYGREIVYYRNRSIMTDTYYVNGVEHGEYISYFENGNVNEKGQYKNGEECGIWEYYISDGSLSKKVEFPEGGGKKVILDNGLELPLPDEIPLGTIDSNNYIMVE